MGEWLSHLYWLPNRLLGLLSEKLMVTLTLPRSSVTGRVWIPVKMALQNGKTQNAVALSSSTVITKALGECPRDRKGSDTLNPIYGIVKSTWQIQPRLLSGDFSSIIKAILDCRVHGPPCGQPDPDDIGSGAVDVWLVKSYKGKGFIKGWFGSNKKGRNKQTKMHLNSLNVLCPSLIV